MAEPLLDQADRSELLLEALRLMQAALKNLDTAHAPADIGACLDEAIQRLGVTLNGSRPSD